MPVDAAPLVSGATYDPVLPVTATAEVITQASLTNTAVALANRIEFLRNSIGIVSDTPDKFNILQEDWRGFQVDPLLAFGTPGYVNGDSGSWGATILGGADCNITASTFPETFAHGNIVMAATGGTRGLAVFKGGMGRSGGSLVQQRQAFRYGSILKMICDMRFDTTIAGVNKFEFGMATDEDAINLANSAAVSIFYDPAGVGANWQFRTSLTAGSSSNIIDSGVPPTVSAQQRLEITYSFSPLQVTFRIKNAGAPTGTTPAVSSTFVPAGSDIGYFGFKSLSASGSAQAVDFMYLAMDSSAR